MFEDFPQANCQDNFHHYCGFNGCCIFDTDMKKARTDTYISKMR